MNNKNIINQENSKSKNETLIVDKTVVEMVSEKERQLYFALLLHVCPFKRTNAGQKKFDHYGLHVVNYNDSANYSTICKHSNRLELETRKGLGMENNLSPTARFRCPKKRSASRLVWANPKRKSTRRKANGCR